MYLVTYHLWLYVPQHLVQHANHMINIQHRRHMCLDNTSQYNQPHLQPHKLLKKRHDAPMIHQTAEAGLHRQMGGPTHSPCTASVNNSSIHYIYISHFLLSTRKYPAGAFLCTLFFVGFCAENKRDFFTLTWLTFGSHTVHIFLYISHHFWLWQSQPTPRILSFTSLVSLILLCTFTDCISCNCFFSRGRARCLLSTQISLEKHQGRNETKQWRKKLIRE